MESGNELSDSFSIQGGETVDDQKESKIPYAVKKTLIKDIETSIKLKNKKLIETLRKLFG